MDNLFSTVALAKRKTSYTYRSFGTSLNNTDALVTSYTVSGEGGDSYTYEYDSNNNITKITNSAGKEIRYTYIISVN